MSKQPSGDAMPMPRILIVDDEDAILKGYAAVLGQAADGTPSEDGCDGRLGELAADLFGGLPVAPPTQRFDLCLCHQAFEAIKAVELAKREQAPFSVAFIDVRLPPGPDGIALAEFIRALDPLVNIVIVTGFSDLSAEDSLDIRIVAEGVENKDQLTFLRDQGCDEAQGYHISRPLTAHAFEQWWHDYPAVHKMQFRQKSAGLHIVN